ncbi:TIGR02221 family CRISPR-associated protein [Geobacillus sp. FSL W8-0032]|uniref:CRISPR-associated protein n=1 Tax=Geobacillus subterraneus TaxID=129338 RepID=A0A679FJ74_9BACL|nr:MULTISPECIES: TIGR02221 family CRISPR-associated protein [Geobacillus]KYD29317.1 hypothetical protein B4113_2260 [Geobacillus sp. B4113_201601]BBW96412.1 hypothetical protein GsuE55_12450 [Geobacillus subterraneus]
MIKFLSFLGTGRYLSGVYHLEGIKSETTPFVQKAVLDILRQQGIMVDRAYIFVTEKAESTNWAGLASELEQLRKQMDGFRYDAVRIPTAVYPQEVWEMFEIVTNVLEEENEVIFDITHSFRYQPMLALLTLHYARITKRVKVLGIYYGLFEQENGEHPIIDLTAFSDMQDWVTNVYSYIQTGNANALSQWVLERGKMIRNQEKRSTEDLSKLNSATQKLKELTSALQASRAPLVSKIAMEASQSLKELQEVSGSLRPMFRPLKVLYQKMEEDISDLAVQDDILSGLAAIEWCINHGLTQQAYTLASELYTTAICLKYKWNPYGKKEEGEEISKRELVDRALTAAMKIIEKKRSMDQYREQYRDEKYLSLIEMVLSHRPLLDILHKIRDYRNDLNHGGWRPAPLSSETLEKKIVELFGQYRSLLLEFWQNHVESGENNLAAK